MTPRRPEVIQTMAIPDQIDRLQRAIASALRESEPLPQLESRPPGPAPGDLYVFGTPGTAALEWLVVRPHPDDPDLVLLAPADDFPLTGPADVALAPSFVARPLTVRCGEAGWFPTTTCTERLRVGTVPEAAVAVVRRTLAALARNTLTAGGEALSVEADPEYTAWLAQVEHAREATLARAEPDFREPVDVIPFSRLVATLPAELAAPAQLALAAEAGGEFFASVSAALAEPDDVRYLEIPAIPLGQLFLMAGPAGVRGVWKGPAEAAPPVSGFDTAGGQLNAQWASGPAGGVHRSDQIFPWIDGRVVVVLGTEPPRTVAVEL